MGIMTKKSKVLYSGAKDRIPNTIISTCFKIHFHEIMNKRLHNEEFPGLFFCLPSIPDWKEKINQHHDNVNLNPIDCSLVSFQPDLLNPTNAEFGSPQVELLYWYFRQVAEGSNAILIRNQTICLLRARKIIATLFGSALPSNNLTLPNSSWRFNFR